MTSSWSERSSQLRDRLLAGEEVPLFVGPLLVRLASTIPSVAHGIGLLYDGTSADNAIAADFHLSIVQPSGPRRWLRPQAIFDHDGHRPFKPLPVSQALALFEWGLNWCIAAHVHDVLILHAAVLERGGRALILPGPPGAGKSTLCAALAVGGWRLLSDELALVTLDGQAILPIPRPISLKNQSIDLIRGRAPDAVFSPPMADTAKGTVALMRPPEGSLQRAGEPARPGWIVLPHWSAGQIATLEPLRKAPTFVTVADNAYNYSPLGSAAFRALTQVFDHCSCWRLTYGDIDEGITLIDGLLDLL